MHDSNRASARFTQIGAGQDTRLQGSLPDRLLNGVRQGKAPRFPGSKFDRPILTRARYPRCLESQPPGIPAECAARARELQDVPEIPHAELPGYVRGVSMRAGLSIDPLRTPLTESGRAMWPYDYDSSAAAAAAAPKSVLRTHTQIYLPLTPEAHTSPYYAFLPFTAP